MVSFEYLAIIFYYSHYISISQTIHNHEYITDLDELLHDAKENHDMAIYGNPLLTAQCKTALLAEHKYNINTTLHWKGLPLPWFWSRESLDATIRDKPLHRRLKITHALKPVMTLPWSSTVSNQYAAAYKQLPSHIVRWYDRLGDKSHSGNTYSDDYEPIATKLANLNDLNYRESLPANVLYYHIEKAGSSSIGSGILNLYKFNSSYISENMLSHTNCGFSFVREPIARFLSAYYTVNRLIHFHNLPGAFKLKYRHDRVFKWWNIVGEPQRITQFVEDLMEFDYIFVEMSPLEHIMSQTGILSISQNDIHFIGRLHALKEHWHKLYEFCDSELLGSYPQKEYARMKSYGIKGIKENPDYAQIMGLSEYEDGDVLPAFKAVADSYDLYHKIAHYYKQDFICFGFRPDFETFRQGVYAKWNVMMERKNKIKD